MTSENFPLGIFPSDMKGLYEYDERYLKLDARHLIYGTKNGTKYLKMQQIWSLKDVHKRIFPDLQKKNLIIQF